MTGRPETDISIMVRIKSQEFTMPPVRDAVVLGRDSPIGCEAMGKALKILQPTEFTHIELAPHDGVISDILVRSSGTPSAAPLRSQGASKRGPKQDHGAPSVAA